jgi:hypothetical protein
MDADYDHVGRADDVIVHLRLRDDGKVLIEYDGIEYGIAQDLIEAGIAHEDILLNMFILPIRGQNGWRPEAQRLV